MRKFIFILAALFMAVSYAYAQSARNAAYNHEGKSNFSDISVQGLDVAGNPGYIEMRNITGNASNNTDAKETYYLWINESGKLCMASYTNISTFSSFPTGDWRTTTTSTWPCTVVGGQS